MKTRLLSFIVLISMCGPFIGCWEDDVPTTLSKAEKKLVDSIYKRDVSKVRQQADSLCDVQQQKWVDYYIDSLKVVYLEGVGEIQEYLKQGRYEK